MDFPGGSEGKESACNAGDPGSWVGTIPWRKKWLPTPEFLPGEFCGQRSLVGYALHVLEELDTTERLPHECVYSNPSPPVPTSVHAPLSLHLRSRSCRANSFLSLLFLCGSVTGGRMECRASENCLSDSIRQERRADWGGSPPVGDLERSRPQRGFIRGQSPPVPSCDSGKHRPSSASGV